MENAVSRSKATRVLLEICIDSVQSALAAEQGGADRLELCANLVEGGTTPSLGMVRAVLAATRLPVMVMIRPRGGHFHYRAEERDVMLRDVAALVQEPVAGIVVGPLRSDGSVDVECCRELLDAARRAPRPAGPGLGRPSVTFHRAFDQVADPRRELETLVDLGVDRVLTSGQCPTAPEGLSNLATLVRQAGDRLVVMPGCGVRGANVEELVRGTGAREVHASAAVLRDTPVAYWRDAVPMHSPQVPGDQQRRETCPAQVRAIRESLDRLP